MSGEGRVPVTEQLTDDTDQGRFELRRNVDLVGWLYCIHLKPDRYVLRHTEVETSHRRQGGERGGGASARRGPRPWGHDHRDIPLRGRLSLANNRLRRSGRRPAPGLLRSCCCRIGDGGGRLRPPGRTPQPLGGAPPRPHDAPPRSPVRVDPLRLDRDLPRPPPGQNSALDLGGGRRPRGAVRAPDSRRPPGPREMVREYGPRIRPTAGVAVAERVVGYTHRSRQPDHRNYPSH